jgi:hypothetical protein
MFKHKKAQIEVTVNWVYILIAGGVILLFFIGIVVKQKAASEEAIAVDVIRVMENIFVGAGVSEKTKNFIDTSGISEFTLYFDCFDGVGEYGIEGRSANIQNSIEPIFSPKFIKSSQLITWSLPYKLPFKVIDFLYITSPNSIYYLSGTDDFSNEFAKEGEELGNVILLEDRVSYDSIDPGKNYQVRVVDTTGELVKDNILVPDKLNNLADDKVTAIVLGSSSATFFQKQNKRWKKLNPIPIPIISLPSQIDSANPSQRNAAKFAAVFAQTPEIYHCNINKAFKKLEHVASLYYSRAQELEDYYEQTAPAGFCSRLIGNADENVKDILGEMKDFPDYCRLSPEDCDLSELSLLAQDLERLNKELRLNCIPIY